MLSLKHITMRSLFLFIFVALFLGACSKDETAIVLPENTMPADTSLPSPLRYLALGDSYTIGESVDAKDRWPLQLADSLSGAGFEMEEVELIARTGWTTAELAEGIASRDPQGPYNLVSLLIGVNNQYRGLDTAEYRAGFRELLEAAIAFADDDPARVIVVSIPDYGVTPFAQNMDPARIAGEIDAFNAIKQQESLKKDVTFINVTTVSREAADDAALIAEDGLHPSALMYSQWVKLILPAALQIMESQAKP